MTFLIQWLSQKQANNLNNLINLETTWYTKVILSEKFKFLCSLMIISQKHSFSPRKLILENYFGTLRSSLMSQRAALRTAREPDWWVAAKGVGTYISRVLMPKPTCYKGKKAVSQVGTTYAELKWLAWITRYTNPPHSPIRTLKHILLNFTSRLKTKEIQTN